MKASKPFSIYILANSIAGPMSGGDRIWIECSRRWQQEGHPITIFTTQEGVRRGQAYGLTAVDYVVQPHPWLAKLGLVPLFLERTMRACHLLANYPRPDHNEKVVVYSSSDFWPDTLPAYWLTRRRRLPWIAAYFLFAPNPLFGFRGAYKRQWRLPSLRQLTYFLSQIPTCWLVNKFADVVFVTSEPDRPRFMGQGRPAKAVIAVQGGVDIVLPQQIPDPPQKLYDAVFIGRFHPQKGVLELIDIWASVCAQRPGAQLAIIGIGDLEARVRSKIQENGLSGNISLLGFQDGIDKIKTFKASRIVLHPALYDSGGMAACEAMACGLPGVSFDLPALRTYYPQGMMKAPVGNQEAFAQHVLHLLAHDKSYNRLQQEALALAKEWDWNQRAKEIKQQFEDCLYL